MGTRDTDSGDRHRNWLYRFGGTYLRAMAMTTPVGMLGGLYTGQAGTRRRRRHARTGNHEGQQLNKQQDGAH